MQIISTAPRVAQSSEFVKLVVEFDVAGVGPREVRQTFGNALRIAIAKGWAVGSIDQAIAEELFRAIPSAEVI